MRLLPSGLSQPQVSFFPICKMGSIGNFKDHCESCLFHQSISKLRTKCSQMGGKQDIDFS